MQHIVGSLVCKYRGDPPPQGHVSELSPFFEIDPHWAGPGQLAPKIVEGHRKIGRRVFNTHLHWEMLPKHKRARFIYVCRDGRDACVSFFHHLSSQRKKTDDGYVFEGTFQEFHERWVAGKIEFGRWADHIASWNNAFGDSRVFFVSYEEMCADLKPVVQRVVKHLGMNDKLGDPEIMELLPTFSFGHMKHNKDRFQAVSVKWKEGFEFLRRRARVTGVFKSLIIRVEMSLL